MDDRGMPAVGFIGLGRMGKPIAERLNSGCDQLIVCSRTGSAAQHFADRVGALVAESPAAVARQSDIVFVMVTNPSLSRQVLLGTEGVIEGARPGAVVFDMGTIGPEDAKSYAAEFRGMGVTFFDAPVSGTVDSAARGELLMMIGGDKDIARRISPQLDLFTSAIMYMGTNGAGAATKLAVNLAVYALAVGVVESLSLIEAAGIDKRAFLPVLEQSAVGAPLISHRREAFLDPDAEPVRFPLYGVETDLSLILQAAKAGSLQLSQTTCNLGVVRRAIAAGHGSEDLASLTKPQITNAGDPAFLPVTKEL